MANEQKEIIKLIKRIKKQEMEAIIEWMDQNKEKLYKIGWSYLRSHHDVEDVFHNTIILIYEKIHQLQKPQFFSTWVTSIFLNECKSIYRKNKKKTIETNKYIKDLSQEEMRFELLDGIDRLDEQFQEVIILKYMSDYSLEEICKQLEIPIGTVKSRLYRGLNALRKEWKRGEN